MDKIRRSFHRPSFRLGPILLFGLGCETKGEDFSDLGDDFSSIGGEPIGWELAVVKVEVVSAGTLDDALSARELERWTAQDLVTHAYDSDSRFTIRENGVNTWDLAIFERVAEGGR